MKPTDKTENEATQLRVFSVYQPPISERLDWDWAGYSDHYCKFLYSVTVNWFWKSINNWRSYVEKSAVHFLSYTM